MRRLTVTSVLAALLLTGCASFTGPDGVGLLGRIKQASSAMVHPALRELTRYLVCGLAHTPSGLELRLSPVGGEALTCSETVVVPPAVLIAQRWDGLGVGAIVDIETGPPSIGGAEFSASNASAAPRLVSTLKIHAKAPK